MIASPAKLRELGIMGMNRRNAEYILEYNPRHQYPLVDDKLRTKELAVAAGIAVPELYGTIRMQHETELLGEMLADRHDFVIKPAHGSGGNGVLVIHGRRRDVWLRSDGSLMPHELLAHHVSNTLSGLYSLGGLTDAALIEYRVKIDPLFDSISHGGVPDVRIVVFRGVPAMAMIRLPTRQSGGRANLHQGGVGLGIDLATGITHNGVLQENPVDQHPDTGNNLAGLQLPHWETMMTLAARCYELTGLGYLGVDLVLDRHRGPLLLELNARPGLSIQIANRQGLTRRLRRIEVLREIPALAADRAELATSLL